MPNLVFRDGFDTYNGVSDAAVGMASKWPDTGGSLQTGRFGTGQCLRTGTGGGSVWNTPTFADLSSFTYESGLKVVSGSSSSTIYFREGSTTHVDLVFATDGTISVRRNGTLLGSSAPGAFVIGTWYSAQFEFVISDTVGRASLYLDGVQKLNLTSQDTRNGLTGVVNRVYLQNNASIDIDDMIIHDSATRLSNPIRAETLYPNADGATLNLVPSTGTSHFAVVDEVLASATDYLQGSNVGDLDLLGLTNLSTTPLSIQELNFILYGRKTDATNRSVAAGYKSGGTTSDGPNYSLPSSGGRFERPAAIDASTGVAWAPSGVNALELQPKVTV